MSEKNKEVAVADLGNENQDSVPKSSTVLQLTKFTLVTYVNPVTIPERLKSLPIQSFAWIVHDKDEDIVNGIDKVHIHLYGTFYGNHKVSVNKIGSLFDVEPNLVCKVKSDVGALQYLIHKNDPDKFQYSFKDIQTNIPNLADVIIPDDLFNQAYRYALYILEDNPIMSFRRLSKLMADNGYLNVLRKNVYFFRLLQQND